MLSSRLRITAASASRRGLGTTSARAAVTSSSTNARSRNQLWALGGISLAAATVAHHQQLQEKKNQQTTTTTTSKTYLDARSRPTGSGDVISTGTPVTEPATGIVFPQLCNGYYLAGCGVRVKWAFVKVYAVGTYMDPLAISAVKTSGNAAAAAIQDALLDPTYPRTLRIVMNRGLSIEKYTDAIVESLKPRMKGQDLEKLEEFKKLNPPVDLVEGATIEMTIRGDTLLYKNAVGGVGSIKSAVFTSAMCDTFYGADPVSPAHKASVIEGIPKL